MYTHLLAATWLSIWSFENYCMCIHADSWKRCPNVNSSSLKLWPWDTVIYLLIPASVHGRRGVRDHLQTSDLVVDLLTSNQKFRYVKYIMITDGVALLSVLFRLKLVRDRKISGNLIIPVLNVTCMKKNLSYQPTEVWWQERDLSAARCNLETCFCSRRHHCCAASCYGGRAPSTLMAVDRYSVKWLICSQIFCC